MALVIAVFMSALIAIINSLIFFVLFGHVGPGGRRRLRPAVPAIMEIALLPISIAGWGGREGLILTFGTLGVPSEIAFGSSFEIAIVTMAHRLCRRNSRGSLILAAWKSLRVPASSYCGHLIEHMP